MMLSTCIMALIMGLTGGLHCAGMCGPIMLFLPFQNFQGSKKIAAISAYHVARVSVYVLMAVVLHSFRELFKPGLQQYISIALGGMLLFAGILSFIPGRRLSLKLPWSEYAKRQLGNFMAIPTIKTTTLCGALNGLLPCGLVYMALSATVAFSSLSQVVFFMYLFGIGTMPILVSISLLKNKLSYLRSARLSRFTPLIVFSFGLIFLFRGLNLGIPYLSPKVEVTQGQIHSCCHKK